jgi:hypothetical protein
MLIKVEAFFNVLYYKDTRKIFVRAKVNFQYSKN